MLFRLLAYNPLLVLPWIVAVILAISVHEFSHALAGYLQGDDTAQAQGRLTLNPLAHLDWLGFGLLLLVGFGWGKPTPYNPYNLKYPKWGSTLVALAGPASNVIMAILALVLYRLLGFTNLNWIISTNLLEAFLLLMAQLNIMLFVFNLIPVPPLDGSKLLYPILGYKYQSTIMKLELYGPWILLGVILFADTLLERIISAILTVFLNLL